MTDKKKLRIFSVSILAVLLISLLVPQGTSGRILAACLLLPAAVLVYVLIKKRPILSMNKSQIIYVMSLIAIVYLALYYLSGLYFGFYNNLYTLNANTVLKVVLPIVVIIVSTEIIRYVIISQEDKLSVALFYFSCVIAETFVYSSVPSVESFSSFLGLVTGTVLPAILYNLLYNYLSKRYGIYPNLIYRLLTTLYIYLIPVVSGISASLINFISVILPIAIYVFIDTLYGKRKKYALKKWRVSLKIVSVVLTVAVLIIMTGTIMLISNQFRYGAYVIATDSMTGELNKGDVALYERYDDQPIIEGQVIAFERDNRVTIHRVVEIQIINGEVRYYTKGDINEGLDTGFVVKSDIIGLVEYKLPYAGYPSIWLRGLFKR